MPTFLNILQCENSESLYLLWSVSIFGLLRAALDFRLKSEYGFEFKFGFGLGLFKWCSLYYYMAEPNEAMEEGPGKQPHRRERQRELVVSGRTTKG